MSTIIKKKKVGFEAVPHKLTLKSQSTKHVSLMRLILKSRFFVLFFSFFFLLLEKF